MFTGTVERVSSGLPFGINCGSSAAIEFTVDTVYKGDVARSAVVIAVTDAERCGLEVKVGKRYTVFPRSINGKLDAGPCTYNVEGAIVPSDYGLPGGHPPRG
ncbi:MAG TPA: hypothetical protein VJP45_06625 [Candidatus Limnocylindria bacterium]|nr:hypothetical protein [Candidatus Limnocylindria bacterium]